MCHSEADSETKHRQIRVGKKKSRLVRMKERGVGMIMKNKERRGSGAGIDGDKGQMGSSRLQSLSARDAGGR